MRRPHAKRPRDLLLELGPKGFSQWVLKQKRLLITDLPAMPTSRSWPLACALMTCWGARISWRTIWETHRRDCFHGNVGSATFDTAMRFLREDFGNASGSCANRFQISVSKCFFVVVTPSATPTTRITWSMDSCDMLRMPEWIFSGCLTVSITYPISKRPWRRFNRPTASAKPPLHRKHLDDRRDKFSLTYYVKLAKELEKWGRTCWPSRTWPGYADRPPRKLVKALKQEIGIPIHTTRMKQRVSNPQPFWRHPAVDVVDLAAASSKPSQPNMNSLVAA